MFAELDVPLAPLTSLGLGGWARRVVRVTDEAELARALACSSTRGEPVFVLGGGSNVVVADEGWAGLVVRVASRGVTVSRRGDRAFVEVAAGENWDAFVARCVMSGWCGVECLSGIPGLVGATPIQNVGAYGQEVKDTIVRVRAFDRELGAFVELEKAECLFGYRTSVFRHNPRYVVVRVAFELPLARPLPGNRAEPPARRPSAPLRYAELTRALGVESGGQAPLEDVRSAVLALRRAKGMVLDPTDPDSVSVGSFFVNPTLVGADLRALEERVTSAGVLERDERIPHFVTDDGRWKVSAGWLVERAGFVKGYGRGKVGVSTKHALALVNRGAGTTMELLALAREIREGVRARFGVDLAPEPVFVGCSL